MSDCLQWKGPADLSPRIGVPGQFRTLATAMRRVAPDILFQDVVGKPGAGLNRRGALAPLRPTAVALRVKSTPDYRLVCRIVAPVRVSRIVIERAPRARPSA